MELHASEILAKELGLKLTLKNDDGVLGLIAPSSSLIITALDGGMIDNQAVNELLASVHLTGQNGTLLTGDVLSLDVINTISLTATDSMGASSSSTIGQLLSANLLNTSSFNTAQNAIITGTDSHDAALNGTAKADRIYGLNGDDTIYAGDGDDLVRGGLGNDHIEGGAGNDILIGGAGNDTLIGGAGNDAMLGGLGVDTYTGGSGTDLVIFELLDQQSPHGGNELDTWTDFNMAEGDMIDVSALLSNFKDGQSDIKDYVSIQHDAATQTTTVSIDRDGQGKTYQAEKLLILDNQSKDFSLEDLINGKNLLY